MGQTIRVIPILLQSSRPRPANPEDEAALQATLASIQQNDTIPSGLSTPAIAEVVSGRMHICECNPAGLESAQFNFTDPKATVLYQESFGQALVWEIGMDGQYCQFSPAGDALLEYWEDAYTFHLQILDLGTQDFQAKF